MLLEIIIALFLGTFAGIFTGLSPGIHINLVGAIIVSLSISLFANIPAVYLVVFIASMSITHTFVDFIPSIFLGAPSTDTELSVLPGHELLKEGRGYEAVMLSNYGSLIAVFMLIILAVPLVFFVPKIYPFLTKFMAGILISFALVLIFVEKNKFSALFVFLLTGILGFFVLNFPGIKEPLLPLLTGLFGSSMLVLSIKNKTEIPKQKTDGNFKIPLKSPILGSIVASPLCGFFPGLGGGQAAIIGNEVAKSDKRGFLVLIGITNTLVMGISFLSLFAIQKSRTGSAVSIQKLIGEMSLEILVLILIVSLISGVLAFFITKNLSKFFAREIKKINYSLLSLMVLGIISIITFVFSGIVGFLVLIIATLTGIYCMSFNVRRTQFMGCLLIPTILFYLFGS